jgi:hypothetical protein
MRPTQLNPSRNGRAECAGNVEQSVLGSQSRLRRRLARASEDVGPDRNAPPFRQAASEELTLVVAPLAKPRCAERDRNERGSLPAHVIWPGQSRHPAADLVGDGWPPPVLEGMNDGLRHRVGALPANASDRPDERRKQVAPSASSAAGRMAAPVATRMRHCRKARPTLIADKPRPVRVALAADANARQRKVS